MAKSKFDFDIVAHDRASKILAHIAGQMGVLQEATTALGRAGVAAGQGFATGGDSVRRNTKKPLSTLDKLGKNLKTVSFGLAALNAPGATAAARLGAVVKAAAKLSEMRKTKVTPPPAAPVNNPFSGLGVTLPPPPPTPPAAGGLMEGAFGSVVMGLGRFTLGLGIAAAAIYKVASAADNFTAKYSGKAQDVLVAAADIGVSTKFLQNMENVAYRQGLPQGTFTSSFAAFADVVNMARKGLNIPAAQHFKTMGVNLGDPWAPRNIVDVYNDTMKAFSSARVNPQTRKQATDLFALTPLLRLTRMTPESVQAQAASMQKSVMTDTTLQKLNANEIARRTADVTAEGTKAYLAGKYGTPLSDPLQNLRNWFFGAVGPSGETRPPAMPARPSVSTEGIFTPSGQPWQAPLLYRPKSESSQQPAPAQQPANQRIDLHITADPGVTVRDRTSPGQSNTNVRIFKSGPDAR